MEAQAKRRYRALPLIASPLHQGTHDHDTPKYTSELSSMKKSHPDVWIRKHDGGTPAFREREEASSIELFYDLFFVANLTSFTTVHAIDDKESESPQDTAREPQDLIRPKLYPPISASLLSSGSPGSRSSCSTFASVSTLSSNE
ncbi:MAG: hypothetical protein L6R42_007378 [Xanthoria sp. 1 TBL-2021]|nr:MAG: hypothetical protein L6R42_007378 [Xanthoria sp. 1 TBL-2021]